MVLWTLVVAVTMTLAATRGGGAALIARPPGTLTLSVARLRRQHLGSSALAGRKGVAADHRDALLDQLLYVAQEGTLLAVAE